MPTFLPARPATSVTPASFLTMSDSAAPMTSWIHGTLYGMFMGSLRPAATGLLPASADVDAAGDDGGVDVGARVELDPRDLGVGQSRLEPALVLHDEVAVGDELVGDAQLARARRRRRPGWPTSSDDESRAAADDDAGGEDEGQRERSRATPSAPGGAAVDAPTSDVHDSTPFIFRRVDTLTPRFGSPDKRRST